MKPKSGKHKNITIFCKFESKSILLQDIVKQNEVT